MKKIPLNHNKYLKAVIETRFLTNMKQEKGIIHMKNIIMKNQWKDIVKQHGKALNEEESIS